MQRRDFLRYALATGAAPAGIVPEVTRRGATCAPDLVATGDLAIVNARVVTIDPAKPEADAILIRSGRIAIIGSNADVRAAARDARVIDAEGRTAIPGFIDGHTHLEWYSYSRSYQVPLERSLESLEAMFRILRERAAKTPAGQWVIGRGDFGVSNQVREQRMPTREEMDAISSNHPVALFSSIHIASLNTAAFKALRLWNRATADDLRWRDGTRRTGTSIPRDAAGLPTGVVTEINDLMYASGLYSDTQRQDAIKAHAVPDFSSKGITSIVNVPSWSDDLRAVHRLHEAGALPLRIRYYPRIPMTSSLQGLVDAGLLAGMGNDMLRFGGIKLFVDGAGNDGTGQRIEDYKWTPEALTDVLRQAQAARLPAILHVVSPGGLRLAIDAIRTAQQGSTPLGHRIDHLGFLRDPAAIAQLKNLQVGVGLTRASKGEGRVRATPDFRALIDAGVRTVAVSDSAGSFSVFSPIAGIGSLVAPASEGGVLPDDRRLTIDEALRAWTLWPAESAMEAGNKGSLTVGKLGDVAMLSDDPRRHRGGGLFDIRVEATILGGRVVFERT